jgi:hypothetical protein
LEVRRCDDGHPPVTERERVIRLNGISGVRFANPDRNFDPGFFVRTVVVIVSEAQGSRTDPVKSSFGLSAGFLDFARNDISVERWALSVERWAFLN